MTDEIQAAAQTPEQMRADAAQPKPLPDARPVLDVGSAGAGDITPSPPAVIDPPREVPAAERLRAFEDEHVGANAVRIGDRIERGYGSPFAALDPEKKRQYAALEKLVEAEQKLADAHAALIQAETDHEAALAAAEPKPDGE